MSRARSILVVRRDNIGDLVCTTPLIRALRARFPDAWLGAFVNSYNAPVLDGNADLDAVYAYTKLKHLDEGQSALRVLARRLRDYWSLRRMRLDTVVLATPAFAQRNLTLARSLGPREIAGFSDGSPAAGALDLSLPQSADEGAHEIERVFALGRLFGIEGEIPALRVVPSPAETEKARAALGPLGDALKVAVHISARRPAQRWPASSFAGLIERLHRVHGAASMLLWFPGPSDHPRHPGDDDKAKEIDDRVRGRAPLVVYRAGPLPELIGALAACDVVVTPDGGAMHLAAALGKPTVALFGDAPAQRWYPWGVEHRVLQPPSRTVLDITVDEVMQALAVLIPRARASR
jgi:ADP-heptose:LPS heptosyltransferase